jgi:hypothetical protein
MRSVFYTGIAMPVLMGLVLLNSACTEKHQVKVFENSIVLTCTYPDAAEVLFASSIDRFRLQRARKVTTDTWEVTVPRQQSFSYFYLVDDKLTLPDCTYTVLDDFGSRNCLYISEL